MSFLNRIDTVTSLTPTHTIQTHTPFTFERGAWISILMKEIYVRTKNIRVVQQVHDWFASSPWLSVITGLDREVKESLMGLQRYAILAAEMSFIVARFPRFRKFLEILAAAIGIFGLAVEFLAVFSGLFSRSKVHELKDEYVWKKDLSEYSLSSKELVNPELVRAHLPDVMEISKIFDITSKMTPKEVTFTDFLEVVYGDYMVIGTHGVDDVVLTFRRGEILEFFAKEQDNRDKFKIDLGTKILSQLKEGIIEIGQVKDNNYGREEHNAALSMAHANDPEFYDMELFERLDKLVTVSIEKKIKTGILLYGEPGVSKTSTVNKILCKVDALRVRITAEGYTHAKKILEAINASKIIILDDIDTAGNAEKGAHNSELLNFLDSECYSVVIIIVNSVNLMTPLIRSGRCDAKIKVLPPDLTKRRSILLNLVRRYGISEDEYWNELLTATEGLTHADLHNIVKTAIRDGGSLLTAAYRVVEDNKMVRADARAELEDTYLGDDE